MKKLLSTLLLTVSTVFVFAQVPMGIRPMVSNEELSDATSQYIESVLKNIISSNDNWESTDWSRIVLAIKLHPTRQDVTPTAPVKVSMDFDVFISIGDITSNHTFKTTKLSLNGIGSSEDRAYVAAIKTIKADNPTITSLLNETRPIVESYYKSHCSQMIMKANTLAKTNNYDEAIYLLTSIPDVCTVCYEKCMKLTQTVYKQKIDYEGSQLLKQARIEWMNGQDREAANRTADVMNGISPSSSAYPEVKKLQNIITNKLTADERREWDMKVKQMQARHETNLSIIEAAKAIGLAWLQSRPQNITKTIIRSWF